MKGGHIPLGKWMVFVNFHGSIATPRLWGYRGTTDNWHIRSILFLWCEVSWYRAS